MSHFARPIRNLEEQRKQLPYGFCGISNPQPPPAVARAHKYAVLQYASNRLRRGKARRLRNRAGSAMFLEPRSGADSGGGVKGRRRVCGFKNFRLLKQARRDSRGQSVSERTVSESSACTSAAFQCFGKIRLSSRRLPFAPILLGKCTSVRAQRVRCADGAC